MGSGIGKMTQRYEYVEKNIEMADAFGETIANYHIPRWEELPNIGLYVDQVITYINDGLAPVMGFGEAHDEKPQLLTKSMINNYVKNDLVWAPVKKHYGKEHIAKLFIITVVKISYSMSDIGDFVHYSLDGETIPDMYNRFCSLFEQSMDCVINHKQFIAKEDTGKIYIQKTIMQSCANKIYASFLLSENIKGN